MPYLIELNEDEKRIAGDPAIKRLLFVLIIRKFQMMLIEGNSPAEMDLLKSKADYYSSLTDCAHALTKAARNQSILELVDKLCGYFVQRSNVYIPGGNGQGDSLYTSIFEMPYGGQLNTNHS